MLLRCTVVDAAAGALDDVEVAAEPGTTVASLLAALPVAVGVRHAYVGQELLNPADTIAGSPLVAGCLISLDVAVPDHRTVPQGAVGVLRVLVGPDAGSWAWLFTGRRTSIGRDERSGLALTDPKVSGRHAEVFLSGDGATVTDSRSTNGTKVAGVPIDEPVPLADGGTFEIGDSLLQWLRLDRVHDDWQRSADGRIEFTRRFHHAQEPTPTSVELPAPLPQNPRTGLTLAVSMGAPILLGVVMALAVESSAFLLMALLTPHNPYVTDPCASQLAPRSL